MLIMFRGQRKFAYTSDGVQAQPLGRAHDFEVLGNVVDHPDWLAKIAAFR